ncbi:phenylalanine--tRNA ligase alpha subunit [Spirochaetia bacterium]|nr:phenylalanine--tRNA ligase alpha subunit [Spirochaetia bacterium]
MDIQNTVKNLHPLEIKIILHYGAGDELCIEKVEGDLGFKAGNGNQALSWLAGKEIVTEKRRETAIFYELTDLGREWKTKGTPEERIIELVRIKNDLTLPEIAKNLNIDNKSAGSAFGSLSKLGLLAMNEAKQVIFAPSAELVNGRPAAAGAAAAYLRGIRGLLDKASGGAGHDTPPETLVGAASGGAGVLIAEAALTPEEKKLIGGIAKKRGAADAAFRIVEKETVFFAFNAAAHKEIAAELKKAGVSGEEIGVLTAEILETGAWKGKNFRSYNVQVPPARVLAGRTSAYAQFLENTKDKLVSLGFEEFDGPLIETEFWNCDALFMPQFHSARDIHDVYQIEDPVKAKKIDEPWLSNVAAAHENGGKTGSRGWDYDFDREFTKRLILRSQGTVMSAKTLPHAKIPGKYFGILRCFRYDKVDATHLSDFYQTEGIVLGDNVNLRTLLGMLEMFAIEIAGAKEVKYVPGYFPFTEPSVEVHIKHPQLGWFELGGSGIFRPELCESLGIHVPVAAWGIGIDRMALMALGLSDLRELFSYNIENVRLRKRA